MRIAERKTIIETDNIISIFSKHMMNESKATFHYLKRSNDDDILHNTHSCEIRKYNMNEL